MTKHLSLSVDVRFPLDAVTQTFLITGKRGSGKSNTAARFVEQLYAAKLPFVVLDPVDCWWGLKAGGPGGKGLDVYIFGGRKQDLPLEARGGALLAEVLCEHRIPMVLSVKHISGRERSDFMVDFATTLFRKWSGGPLHVVLEEAHELAPQNCQNSKDGEQRMLGAFKRLWKLGRSQGIGGSAITQRPASLSKDITTQSEILIAHRIIGPQDVKAVGEWVKYHGQHQEMLAELSSLPTGEAFIWAPEFPEGDPLGLVRTKVDLRETYDSASTPKVGEKRIEPKVLAPVDLERLRGKMAATLEQAKANDPGELKKQIAELKRQLAAKPAEAPAAPERVEVPVLRADDVEQFTTIAAEVMATLLGFNRKLDAVRNVAAAETAPVRPSLQRAAAAARPAPAETALAVVNGDLTNTQQEILDTVLMLELRGLAPNREMIARWRSIHPNGGRYTSDLAALRAGGQLDGCALTVAGRQKARFLSTDYEALLMALPDEPKRQIVRALHGGHIMTRDSLAATLGIHPNGGRYTSNLAWLRQMGVIPERGEIQLTRAVFK